MEEVWRLGGIIRAALIQGGEQLCEMGFLNIAVRKIYGEMGDCRGSKDNLSKGISNRTSSSYWGWFNEDTVTLTIKEKKISLIDSRLKNHINCYNLLMFSTWNQAQGNRVNRTNGCNSRFQNNPVVTHRYAQIIFKNKQQKIIKKRYPPEDISQYCE